MLCSILSLRAQTFVKPAVKVKDTSFAVITDKGTFQAWVCVLYVERMLLYNSTQPLCDSELSR